MFEFRRLPDTHSSLTESPLLRGAVLTLNYAIEHDGIGLTATKAFKRDFMHWAVHQFNSPGRPAEDRFRFQRFVNETDFPPLQLIHFFPVRLRLGRHCKGRFWHLRGISTSGRR